MQIDEWTYNAFKGNCLVHFFKNIYKLIRLLWMVHLVDCLHQIDTLLHWCIFLC